MAENSSIDYINKVQRSDPKVEYAKWPYLVVPHWILNIENENERHYIAGYWEGYHSGAQPPRPYASKMNIMGYLDGAADREAGY